MASRSKIARSTTRTKTLPYRAAKKPRSSSTNGQKKARPGVNPGLAPPVPLTFRDYVHDALDAVEAARRAYDDQKVFEFRGKHDRAQYEGVAFHEALMRVHNCLMQLDLEMHGSTEMPDGGAS